MGTMNRKIEDDGVNTYKGVNDATIGMMIGQCEQNHGWEGLKWGNDTMNKKDEHNMMNIMVQTWWVARWNGH